ncbi:dihydrolipoyl dehydrogenase family protein [Scytonema sp. NUACC26]|uniref:dihydrolipoyl dehydrogenase family protein n=1 Tax=Scytonema sp. NUACC26 TaxID=3140176 RepID=UPI0034DCB71C
MLNMTRKFDLIVIGTGVAGSTVAKQCRAAGWDVAIIDSLPFGGTCALRGCTPKKVLVDAAALMDWNHRMLQKGIDYQNIRIDWQALMRFKRTFTSPVPQKREQEYAEAGIAMFHGRARFVDETTVQVNDDTLQGRYVLIATGSKPLKLGIPGEEYVSTSDQFLELEQLPQRIIFVGGGYISFESAHVSVRAGANVQILHEGEQPLEHFDPDLVNQLVQATQDIGIDVRVNTKVKAIEKDSDYLIVRASTPDGEQTFETELVIHGASRMPDLDDLDLEKAGVKREKKGVSVNEYLQSVSNPAVYAAGDVAATGAPQLTPVANMEAEVVANNLLKGDRQKPDYTEVPSVVFTTPTLAMVGHTEETAREKGLKFRTNHQDTSSWHSSSQKNMKYSSFKVLIKEDSNQILGAHLLGPDAQEVINVFAMAIRAGFSTDELKKMIFAYPTGASDINKMV